MPQVGNVPATAFATRVEALLVSCLPPAPTQKELRRFARALQLALGHHLKPYPLCGIGALPTCCGSSNYISDMSCRETGGSFESRLAAALATQSESSLLSPGDQWRPGPSGSLSANEPFPRSASALSAPMLSVELPQRQPSSASALRHGSGQRPAGMVE